MKGFFTSLKRRTSVDIELKTVPAKDGELAIEVAQKVR